MQQPENPESNQPEQMQQATEEQATTETAASDETIENDMVETVDIASPDLQTLLKEAELKAAENHDAWLRSKADMENTRRRAQTDVANAHKYAIDSFSAELIPVMDSLDAALTVENATVENFKDGMELTQKQLHAVFEKFNIKVINPDGEKFNPHHHQAISSVESDIAPNTVLQVMQKGYLLHDRIIRPALVSVSKAKESPTNSAPEEQ